MHHHNIRLSLAECYRNVRQIFPISSWLTHYSSCHMTQYVLGDQIQITLMNDKPKIFICDRGWREENPFYISLPCILLKHNRSQFHIKIFRSIASAKQRCFNVCGYCSYWMVLVYSRNEAKATSRNSHLISFNIEHRKWIIKLTNPLSINFVNRCINTHVNIQTKSITAIYAIELERVMTNRGKRILS